jgi:outer membrane protein assembly factor BamB
MKTTRRPADWLLTASHFLFLAFVALLAYEKLYATRDRGEADPALIEELADAEFDDGGAPTTADWPQWRGPRRDGIAGVESLAAWPKNGLKELWRAPAVGGYSSVAVANGRAYTLVNHEGGEAVVCWDAADGSSKWRFPYAGPGAAAYPGPRATPTIDGDRVYTVGAGGQFHCLNAATGEKLWQHELRAEFNAPGGQWGHACSPLVEGKLVIVTPGGPGASVVAFDKENGELAWKALDDPAGYSSPVAFTAGGVRHIVCFTGNSVLGISPQGKPLWRYSWQTQFNVNAATPLVFHARKGEEILDLVFISSGYGKGCALLKLQKTPAGDFLPVPVFVNNHLCSHFGSLVRRGPYVFGFNEARLTCLDLRTGAVRWKQDGYLKGSLLRAGDRLLVLGEMGKLALMDATPDEPKALATAQPLKAKCWTMPVVAEGRLYLRDESEVLCLDARGN